jgi:hypothetical protein
MAYRSKQIQQVIPTAVSAQESLMLDLHQISRNSQQYPMPSRDVENYYLSYLPFMPPDPSHIHALGKLCCYKCIQWSRFNFLCILYHPHTRLPHLPKGSAGSDKTLARQESIRSHVQHCSSRRQCRSGSC